MRLRKIYGKECERTIPLWKEIFPEDTDRFLAYYYSEKTKENCIYIIEEEDTICAMLHINPYQLCVGGKILKGHYIVAVATREEYRHRKYMSQLLKASEEDMKEAGEPFTFLMPAAKEIYLPHGFRYIYRQQRGKIKGKDRKESGYAVSFATKKEDQELSLFSNELLMKMKDIVTYRDERYYELLRKEQESENGNVVIVRKGKKMVGTFSYTKDEKYEIREPLFLKGEEGAFEQAVYELTGNEQEEVSCYAYGDEYHPDIMAKILNIKAMLECVKTTKDTDFIMTITDAPDMEKIGTFHIWGTEHLHVEDCKETKNTKKIGIGDLTSIIFGYEKIDLFDLPQELKKELSKLIPLSEVFLNEVV